MYMLENEQFVNREDEHDLDAVQVQTGSGLESEAEPVWDRKGKRKATCTEFLSELRYRTGVSRGFDEGGKL